MKKVNMALQVIPLVESKKVYDIVDEAIECIINSGIKYLVTPFETVLEGNLDELLQLVKKVQDACYIAGAEEIIINIKIHSSNVSDVLIKEKMTKYE